MKPRLKQTILFAACIFIVVLCLILIATLSGFRHESRKFRALLFVIVLVLFFHALVGDFIKLPLYAIYAALRKRKHAIEEAPTDVGRSEATNNYDEDALLRLQLASYEASMYTSPAHYNESLNLKYKQIVNELRLYGLYFVLLLFLIACSRDQLSFYNTKKLKMIFEYNHLDASGLGAVHTIDDVYHFLELIIVRAFNLGRDCNGALLDEPGWIQYGIAKLLGVVRLRQVRRKDTHIGLSAPVFDEENYMPHWTLPYEKLHYINKYMHTYGPWLAGRMDWSIFTPSHHYGHIHTYPEDNGYVAFLSRDYNNSRKILEYLKKSHWFDRRTAGIFVDFTLYNADSNIFSVCTILLERTPYGNVLSHIDVHSVQLLMNLDNASGVYLIAVLLYIFSFIYFTKYLILNQLYKTKISVSVWNKVDFVIIVLNVAIIVVIVVREFKVHALMAVIESAMKLEFVDFRVPARIDGLANILVGFLVCLTTLRLWKVFQFARAFRLFTRTLYSARWAIMTLMLVIVVWLFAFGIASYIVNGNYSPHFTRLLKSFSASMSYSFGFSKTVTPDDLTHGGLTFGFILYALLMFIIEILLLNLFITLICDYFADNKNSPDDDEASELGFYEFLRVEYGSFWRCLKRCFSCVCCTRRAYTPGKDDVRQRMAEAVEKAERKREQHERTEQRKMRRGKVPKDEEDEMTYGRKLRDIKQVRAMTRRFSAQVALLRHIQRWRRF